MLPINCSLRWLPLFAVMAVICGCGGETTEVERDIDETGVPILEKGVSLRHSDCNKNSIGDVVYVADSAAVYYCTTYGWRHLTGKDGRNGKNGKDGRNGADGTDGEPGIDGVDCSISSFSGGYAVICGSSQDAINITRRVPRNCEVSSVSPSGFKILCDDDVAVQKAGVAGEDGEDCKIRQLDSGAVEFACVNDTVIVHVATCGGKPYDPETEYCVLDTVRTAEEYKMFKKCWDTPVDWSNHFCDTRDGKVYRYTKIGKQVWMAQNLAYVEYKKTPSISGGHTCYFNGDDYENGCLYTWGAAIDSAEISRYADFRVTCGYERDNKDCHLPGTVQGICPKGWHLPTAYDIGVLLEKIGKTSPSSVLKSVNISAIGTAVGWVAGDDLYGFSVLPPPSTSVQRMNFWTTEFKGTTISVLNIPLKNDSASIDTLVAKNKAFIRCMRD